MKKYSRAVSTGILFLLTSLVLLLQAYILGGPQLVILTYGSNIVASGNFNAGGSTAEAPPETLAFGEFDGTDDYDMYWIPTETDIPATTEGNWTQVSHGGGLAWDGWFCTNDDKMDWELPLAGLNTAGTVWFDLYVEDGAWSGTDVVHVIALKETATACNYPGSPAYTTLAFQLMNSGAVDPMWQFLRFNCGGVAYSRDVQYFSGTSDLLSGGWHRVGFTWKFEDGDLWVSVSIGGTWYDDSYEPAANCTGPWEDFAFLEVGG